MHHDEARTAEVIGAMFADHRVAPTPKKPGWPETVTFYGTYQDTRGTPTRTFSDEEPFEG